MSFLIECNNLFGSSLKIVSPGESSGSVSIPLPVGSVLILNVPIPTALWPSSKKHHGSSRDGDTMGFHYVAFDLNPSVVKVSKFLDEAILLLFKVLQFRDSGFSEKGELPTRFGSATLGILLLQVIAVVPLLVMLPVLESQNLIEENFWPILAQESLKVLGCFRNKELRGLYCSLLANSC